MSPEKVIDWDRLKCYGCGAKAVRVHNSMVVPVCDRYPYCTVEESVTTKEG